MIGDRIRNLREKLGKSQEEFAHSINMHPNTIARWERGELTPRGTSIAKIAKALDTSTDYLLGDTDNPSNSVPISIVSGNDEASSEFMEKIVKSNKMVVYETKNGNGRIFIPVTDDGFRFFQQMISSNLVVQPA